MTKSTKTAEILCWKFFIYKYNLTTRQMRIAQNLCELICNLGETATVEIVTKSIQYKNAISGLSMANLNETKIQTMIDFE